MAKEDSGDTGQRSSGRREEWRGPHLAPFMPGAGGERGREKGRISEPRGICRLLGTNMGVLPIGQFLAALPPALPSRGPAGNCSTPTPPEPRLHCSSPPSALIPFFTPITHRDALIHILTLPRLETPQELSAPEGRLLNPVLPPNPPHSETPLWNYVLKPLSGDWS